MANKRKSPPIKIASEDFLFPTKRPLLSPLLSRSSSPGPSEDLSDSETSRCSPVASSLNTSSLPDLCKEASGAGEEQEKLKTMLFKIFQYVSEHQKRDSTVVENKPLDLSRTSPPPPPPVAPPLCDQGRLYFHQHVNLPKLSSSERRPDWTVALLK